MVNPRMLLSVLAALWALASFAQAPPAPYAGDWVGGYAFDGPWTVVRLHLEATEAGPVGSWALPDQNLGDLPLLSAAFREGELEVVLDHLDGPLTMKGAAAGGRWAGIVLQGGNGGRFEMVRPAALTTDALARFEGIYRLPSGKDLKVFLMDGAAGPPKLTFIDRETGRLGTLQPHAARAFVAAASMQSPLPVAERVEFLEGTGGTIRAVRWERDGKAAVEAVRQDPFTVEPVAFANGDIKLEGRLYRPKGAGPAPGIVLVHGSGKGSWRQLVGMAQFFASRGLAALVYDKRGCGGSGGDWRRAGFPELARDALAGVRWLQGRPGVDPKRVGLYGISQGGWIVALAASLEPGVGFFISHSGPAVSPAEQERTMLRAIFKGAGFADEETAKVLDAYKLLYDYGKTGKGAEALDAAVAALKKDPKLAEAAPDPSSEVKWEKYYGGDTYGDPGWFLHLDPDYDPLPAWRKVKCPALALYGALDWTVPVKESVAALEGALKDNEGHRVSGRVLAKAAHGLPEPDPADPRRPASPGRVAPDLLETLEEWLTAHGLTTAAPAPPPSK
jgi:hypothetical protein